MHAGSPARLIAREEILAEEQRLIDHTGVTRDQARTVMRATIRLR
jgi:hypothetical protein